MSAVIQFDKSIDAVPQQKVAASQQMLVAWSSSRYVS